MKLKPIILSNIILIISCATLSATEYSSIWSIGDSLTDMGRTFDKLSPWYLRLARRPVGPLYHDGRFSNGSVWTEYLAEGDGGKRPGANGLPGVNYAWAGAITGKTDVFWSVSGMISGVMNAIIPSLEHQLDEDMLPAIGGQPSKHGNGRSSLAQFGPDPLVTVWIGGNNFRVPGESAPSAGALKGYHTARQFIVNNVPAAVQQMHEKFVGNMSGAGGRVPRSVTYYTPTVPDVSRTPDLAGLDAASKAELSGVVRQTNRELKKRLLTLGDALAGAPVPGRVVIIDAAALMEEVTANPGDFNLTNVTDACVNAATGRYAGACNAANANSYLYWDNLHPTTAVHRLLADYATITDRLDLDAPVAFAVPYVANIEWRDQVWNSTISGPGRLVKRGESMLTLTGDNTWSGGVRFDEGAVRVLRAENLGDPTGDLVFRGGSLRGGGTFTITHRVRLEQPVTPDYGLVSGNFDIERGYTVTLAGPMLEGDGNLRKSGDGVLDIRSPIASARVLTDVVAGKLLVNSPDIYESHVIVVREGAALGGSGKIRGAIANHGAIHTARPGHNLMVMGDFTQSPDGKMVISTAGFVKDQSGDPARGPMHVNGHMQLDGAVVAKIYDEKFTRAEQVIVSSDDSISGSFSAVQTTSPFVGITLSQDATAVTASLNRDFTMPAASANQNAVGRYLNTIYRTAPQGDLDRIYRALDQTHDSDGGRRALDGLSGASLATADNAVTAHVAATQRAILGLAGDSRQAAQHGAGDGAGIKKTGDARIRAQMSGLTWRGAGKSSSGRDSTMLASIEKDWAIGKDIPVTSGIALSHGQMDGAWRSDLRGINASSFQIAGYATARPGPLFVDMAAGAGLTDGRTRRAIAFGDLRDATTARHRTSDVFASLRIGVTFDMAGLTVEPSIGLDWLHVTRRALRETGAGAASVLAARRSADILTPSIGLDASHRFVMDNGLVVEPSAWVRLQISHSRRDRMRHSLAGAPSAGFSLDDATIRKPAGNIVGARIAIGQTDAGAMPVRVFAAWEHSQLDGRAAHSLTAGLATAF